MVGCKKDTKSATTSQPSPSLEKIDNDLRNITNKCLLGAPAGKTTGPNGWVTAGADVAAGVAAGNESWEWCATPLGGFLAGLFITG